MASAAEVNGLRICWVNTMEQIDCALDTGNRRAFRVWCGRLASFTARIESLLTIIATAEE